MAIGRWLKRLTPRSNGGRLRVFAYGLPLVLLAGEMGLVRYWRMIPVRPETTAITAPLKADGYPDYVAWLDQKGSAGVTQENNAAIPLLQAANAARVLPRAVPQLMDSAAQALGSHLTPVVGPEKPDFITLLEKNLEARGLSGDARDRMYQATYRHVFQEVWQARDVPMAAAWVGQSTEALQLFHEAMKRDHFYLPALTWDGRRPQSVAQIEPSGGGIGWRLARVLRARALMRAGDGDYAGALQDVADLLAHDKLLASSLYSPDAGTDNDYRLMIVIAQALPAAEATRWLTALQAFKPPVGDSVLEEMRARFEQLEIVQRAASRGMQAVVSRDLISTTGPNTPTGSYFTTGAFGLAARLVAPINYPKASREINHYFDQLHALRALPEGPARKQLMAELARQRETVFAAWNPLSLLVDLPPYWEHDSTNNYDLAKLALALAIYQKEHGTYPEALALLVPDPLQALSPAASDPELRYQRTNQGYLFAYRQMENGKEKWRGFLGVPLSAGLNLGR